MDIVAPKPYLPYLETMLTYACTLSCANCTNYSDYGMKGGYVKWQDAKPWLDHWYSRVRIGTFGFIGGEPLLNPELKTWIHEFRNSFPKTKIMIVTNAQLFSKNLWLLDTINELGNIHLKFSNHIPNSNYIKDAVDAVHKKFNWTQQTESDESNKFENIVRKITFEICTQKYFLKTYKGEYGTMKPFNNNPNESFKICSQQLCPLMYQGRLYKCSSSALLDRVLSDHNQIDDTEWSPYLNQYIDINCSDKDLLEYIDNYSRPSKVCSMCPTEADKNAYEHLSSVVSKIKIY